MFNVSKPPQKQTIQQINEKFMSIKRLKEDSYYQSEEQNRPVAKSVGSGFNLHIDTKWKEYVLIFLGLLIIFIFIYKMRNKIHIKIPHLSLPNIGGSPVGRKGSY